VIVRACYQDTLSMKSLLLLFALVLLPARSRAEGSTLTSEKVGACALLTAADAQRFSNVPMEVQAGPPGNDSPGRNCGYRPVRPGPGHGTVELRLLDAREWSHFKQEADASRLEIEGIKGIGDEAYAVRKSGARRAGDLVLFVRRRSSQFSVRFTGVRPQLTDPMKRLARGVAGRL
jgi:hypothetical protein